MIAMTSEVHEPVDRLKQMRRRGEGQRSWFSGQTGEQQVSPRPKGAEGRANWKSDRRAAQSDERLHSGPLEYGCGGQVTDAKVIEIRATSRPLTTHGGSWPPTSRIPLPKLPPWAIKGVGRRNGTGGDSEARVDTGGRLSRAALPRRNASSTESQYSSKQRLELKNQFINKTDELM